MSSISSLLLLPDPFRTGVVVPLRASSMGKIEPLEHYLVEVLDIIDYLKPYDSV